MQKHHNYIYVENKNAKTLEVHAILCHIMVYLRRI